MTTKIPIDDSLMSDLESKLRADKNRVGLTGIGRVDLEALYIATLSSKYFHQKESAKHLAEVSRAMRENEALTANVTHLQVKANGALASHRLAKVLEHEPELMAALLDLVWGIDKARKTHPEGCSYFALGEETGEVGRALAREDPERLSDELLDVAIVAIRMRLGEIDARLAPVEPHAARSA